MSVRVMAAVWDRSNAEPTDRLVLLAIADCANDTTAEAYPAMAALAKKTGLHERSVQRCLARLVALGELAIQPRGGPRGCNRYRVILHPGATPPPAERHPGVETPRQNATPADGHPNPGTAPPPTPAQRHPNHQGTVREPPESPSGTQRARTHARVRGTDDPDFDRFWSIYPRREAKTEAQRAWAKATRRATADVICAGAERYRDAPGRELRYTAHPATWLNGDRWQDEPLPRGSPNGRASPDGLVEVDGHRVRPETAHRLADQARWVAEDEAAQRKAIEGRGG